MICVKDYLMGLRHAILGNFLRDQRFLKGNVCISAVAENCRRTQEGIEGKLENLKTDCV